MDLIIACDTNGGIGYNGHLPWGSCRNDLRHYCKITNGRDKLITRKTWDTLPPDISRKDEYRIISRRGMDVDTAAVLFPDSIIVSGAEIYTYVMEHNLVDTLYLTSFQGTYPADTFIAYPNVEQFDLLNYQSHLNDEHPHVFITLRRKECTR